MSINIHWSIGGLELSFFWERLKCVWKGIVFVKS